jgi:hypothetical protein
MAILVRNGANECGKTATAFQPSTVAIQPQPDSPLTVPASVSKLQAIETTVFSCNITGVTMLADRLLSCLQPSQRP